jgi:TRAP-type C4-dicarboxylate transport system substrate-binding protein
MYPSMGLGGKPPELINQVRDGVADVTFTLPTYTPGRFPVSEVFELPFVNADAVTMARALQDFYAQHLRDQEYRDFHMLAMSASAGNAIHSSKPIKGVQDLKALKIRTSGASGVLFLESVGAIPISMPITELSSALSKGVVDACMLPFEILPAFKIHEMTKYHVTLEGGRRFNATIFIFLMNKARYEKLPPELKKVIDANSGVALAEKAARNWNDFERIGEQAVRDRGNELAALSKAESYRLEKLSASAIDKWIADMNRRGVDGDKMVKAARAAIAKHQTK